MNKELPPVAHEPAQHQFALKIGEHTAIAKYTRGDGYIVFPHTEVPDALQGQGVGSALAKFVLEYAQDQHLQVMPLCSFIASYIRRHPEYKFLLRPGFEV